MKIENNEMVAEINHYISRKGSDSYFVRCSLLNGETEEDFVEITSAEKKRLDKIKEEEFLNN